MLQAESTPHLLPFWRPLSNLQADTWELLSFRLRQPFDMRITCWAGKQVLLRYDYFHLKTRDIRHFVCRCIRSLLDANVWEMIMPVPLVMNSMMANYPRPFGHCWEGWQLLQGRHVWSHVCSNQSLCHCCRDVITAFQQQQQSSTDLAVISVDFSKATAASISDRHLQQTRSGSMNLVESDSPQIPSVLRPAVQSATARGGAIQTQDLHWRHGVAPSSVHL